MKKRILTVILSLLTVFSFISPAFAIPSNSNSTVSPFFYADHAGVLSNEAENGIISANYDLLNILDDAQITVISLKAWDGDYISEPAYKAMQELGFTYASDNIDMVIIFDIYEGNYSIFAGHGIQDLFDDSTANMYLEEHFLDSYNKGDYDGAVLSLITALADWYETNSSLILENVNRINAVKTDSKPDNYHRWYESVLFIAFASIISFVIIHILYGFSAKAANSKRRYKAFYLELGMSAPFFHIWHIWRGPHFDWNGREYEDRSIWSFISEIWDNPLDLTGWFKLSKHEQNIFDIFAVFFKALIFILVCLILLFFLISAGGGSGGSSSSNSSSGSGGSSSSGRGGGGRSGGGGAGRR